MCSSKKRTSLEKIVNFVWASVSLFSCIISDGYGTNIGKLCEQNHRTIPGIEHGYMASIVFLLFSVAYIVCS